MNKISGMRWMCLTYIKLNFNEFSELFRRVRRSIYCFPSRIFLGFGRRRLKARKAVSVFSRLFFVFNLAFCFHFRNSLGFKLFPRSCLHLKFYFSLFDKKDEFFAIKVDMKTSRAFTVLFFLLASEATMKSKSIFSSHEKLEVSPYFLELSHCCCWW